MNKNLCKELMDYEDKLFDNVSLIDLIGNCVKLGCSGFWFRHTFLSQSKYSKLYNIWRNDINVKNKLINIYFGLSDFRIELNLPEKNKMVLFASELATHLYYQGYKP